MPRADRYIAGLFAPNTRKTVVLSRVLRPSEITILSTSLREDAADLYYSGWISFLDALNGIERKFYTWATVKLYYSVFYSFRASLALSDLCVFHVGRTQYTAIARAGETPTCCTEAGTHKVVLKSFERRYPNHPLLSQQIGLDNVVDWLINKREAANYGNPRFSDPFCGPEFDVIAKFGIRKTINDYLGEHSPLYVFDPDHAMVAFPLRALQLIGNDLLAVIPTSGVNSDEENFLKTCVKDRSGFFTQLHSEMKRITLVDP